MRHAFSSALSMRAALRKYLRGFTLVELIVVITILALLWTIWLLSFSNYSSGARDSTRVEDLTNIQKSLAISATTSVNGKYPLPDNGVQILNAGVLLRTQGYAGKTTLTNIKFNGAGLDPLDSQYYTYSVTNTQTGFALMAYLENASNLTLTSYIEKSLAATTDYSTRFPMVQGNPIGVLIASGSLQPLQATTNTGVELQTNTAVYTAYIAPKITITSSGGLTLATAMTTAGSGMTSTGTIIVLVNGICTGILSNAVYTNSLTSYSIQNASVGTSLIAAYSASPTTNTCQFNCASGYTWTGTGCTLSTVSGPCTSLPSNAAYYGSGSSYSLASAPSGTSLVASFSASTPTTNTCQFNCMLGYSWNGTACLASSVNGSCTSLPSNAVYYGGVTSYSLVAAALGTSLTASYTGGTLIPNSCMYNCASGYGWNGSACTAITVTCAGTNVTQTSHKCVFNYTGSAQSISIPWGNVTLTVNGWGGGGGSWGNMSGGSAGGSLLLPVNTGDTISIYVASGGNTDGNAGGGGGATYVLRNATPVLVLGGGGGSGANGSPPGGPGLGYVAGSPVGGACVNGGWGGGGYTSAGGTCVNSGGCNSGGAPGGGGGSGPGGTAGMGATARWWPGGWGGMGGYGGGWGAGGQCIGSGGGGGWWIWGDGSGYSGYGGFWGSSYASNGTSSGTLYPGSGGTPGGTGLAGYVAGIGAGTTTFPSNPSNNGMVVVTW